MRYSAKKGFTLVELVFVIVIVGIISTMATDIYLNVYRNYVYSKIINELESKTDALLEQISSRLSDRVKSAVIARESNLTRPAISLYSADLDENHTILEWIGESVESKYLNGNNNFNSSVGWSGYLNLKDTNRTNFISPGSNFNLIRNNNDLVGGNSNNLAIIFNSSNLGDSDGYGFAQTGGGVEKIMDISLINNSDRAVINRYNDNNKIFERYSLAHTAYAIVPDEDIKSGKFNLFLYYNYRPWLNETFQRNGSSTILAKDVTMFRFRSLEGAIELKICMQGQNIKRDGDGTRGDFGDGMIVCKSKVVY